jgi:two-component system response regulator AtoC
MVELLGESEGIRRIQDDLNCATASDAKVLISGESGVGKEVVARLIHDSGSRRQRPMVCINCAGIPDTLLASELFGHVRGSFTDASRDRMGLLEQGHRGTVFLDEVGEMSPSLQSLVLRFLENGEIQRVGSEARLAKVDVRVIAATNRVLLDRVGSGEFREDLYYRLNVIHIEIPPLRSRIADVPLLLNWFLRHFSVAHHRPVPTVSADAMTRLMAYHWPGNVRELKNLAERLVVRWSAGEITASQLPLEMLGQQPAVPVGARRASSRADAIFDAIDRGENFWLAVHAPFMARDLTRDDLRLVIRKGLTATRGNYKALVQLFNMPADDYKKFLNFLRKHQAHLPIHEFRAISREPAAVPAAMEAAFTG